jgi:hypothetical protein
MGMRQTACAVKVIEQASGQPIKAPWRPACEEPDVSALARIVQRDRARNFPGQRQRFGRQEGIVQRIDHQCWHCNAAQELSAG